MDMSVLKKILGNDITFIIGGSALIVVVYFIYNKLHNSSFNYYKRTNNIMIKKLISVKKYNKMINDSCKDSNFLK